LKTREISINENFLQEPGIGPKLVLSEACPEHGRMGRMDPWFKIGNIFRQFSIKNADTSEQKSKFLKNF